MTKHFDYEFLHFQFYCTCMYLVLIFTVMDFKKNLLYIKPVTVSTIIWAKNICVFEFDIGKLWVWLYFTTLWNEV